MHIFRVGYASVKINPTLGIAVHGYFVPRFASGFLDDLEASALALELEDKQVLLLSLDNCFMETELVDSYRKTIEEQTGFPADHIFLTVTHTHTAPCLGSSTFFEAEQEPITHYTEFVRERLVELVKLAVADLKPAKMGFIQGQAPDRIAYIRRYKMKDGSTCTCPPINDPNIDHPIGQLDQRVNVLRFDQENGQTVVLLNYGIHADTVGGDVLSSDWVGWTRRTIETALDGVKVMCIMGAQGDVGSTHVNPSGGDMNDTEISFDNEMKSPGMARFVGRALSGTILQVFDKAEYVDVDRLHILRKVIHVPSNMPLPEELPRAKLYKALHDTDREDEIPYTAMERTTVVAEALRMCKLEYGPEFFPMPLTGVVIGPVAMVGIPGEPFTEIGVQLKNTAGWSMILPCALANGYEGYFPMQEAYDEGGYEARSSRFKAGVAELIIRESKALLHQLHK